MVSMILRLSRTLRGGTDAAREHADVVLTDDDLLRLPQAVDIARSAMNLVKETMALVAVPNSIGLVLTACGMVGPAGATVLNNGSAVVAAVNSLRPIMGRGYTRLPKDEVVDRSKS
jgi:cation transport ATPase